MSDEKMIDIDNTSLTGRFDWHVKQAMWSEGQATNLLIEHPAHAAVYMQRAYLHAMIAQATATMRLTQGQGHVGDIAESLSAMVQFKSDYGI